MQVRTKKSVDAFLTGEDKRQWLELVGRQLTLTLTLTLTLALALTLNLTLALALALALALT